MASSVQAARLAHSTDSLAATSSSSGAGSSSSSGGGGASPAGWAGVFFGRGGERAAAQGGSAGASSASASGWSSEAVREMEAAGEIYNRTREHTFEAKAVEENVRLLR